MVSYLSIFIPSIVTIIGFIVSYRQNKKYIANEV